MLADDGRVVSNFIVQALAGSDLTVYGDGTQTRSFCFVDDLVEGLIRMMATGHEVTGPINLGNPNELSVGGLAELVTEMVGGGRKVIYEPLPEDDPKQRQPDISKAQQVLGWEPTVDLETGLKATVEWFRRDTEIR